jgi:hypothetical protein
MVLALGWALAGACAHAPRPAASGVSPGAADRTALFERKCGACHPASWRSYGTTTPEEWARLVERMRGFRSGWITDGEAAAIAEYGSAQIGVYSPRNR